jgi:hypothetical protein
MMALRHRTRTCYLISDITALVGMQQTSPLTIPMVLASQKQWVTAQEAKPPVWRLREPSRCDGSSSVLVV